ncbi:MAG: pyridoxamine kinase [Selenomonadaceae bacterium]|nr:pyridoxamine kinase [Selenomonadaceae bacterium]
MRRQQRIALINDITGFGRCSVTVQLPIISALKVQACPLPTALLSVHTGFPLHYLMDFTPHMRPYLENWQRNGLEFDGILTGFLASTAQIELVLEFAQKFRRENTLVIVDPVMGDDGKLYASYTEELCQEMRRLLSCADVVTPNLTEACRLLEIPYPQDGQVSDRDLRELAAAIAAQGPRQVVITGVSDGAQVKNFLYEKGREPEIQRLNRVGGERSGTGDAFAAIVAAALVKGESLSAAVRRAALFICKVLAFANELDQPWNYGLPFEEYLTEL